MVQDVHEEYIMIFVPLEINDTGWVFPHDNPDIIDVSLSKGYMFFGLWSREIEYNSRCARSCNWSE